MPLKIQFGERNEVPAGRGGSVNFRAPRRVVWPLGALILVLIVAAAGFGFWSGQRQSRHHFPASVVRAGETKSRSYLGKSGPWGEIVCQQSVMELPPEELPVRFYQAEKVRWFFRDFTPDDLRQLWVKAGCSQAQQVVLRDTNTWEIVPAGIWVQPPDDLVLGLRAESRKQIYLVLGRFKENEPQREPFHWPADHQDSLFAGAGISAETRSQFERLWYQNGNVLLFADLQVLLRSLPDLTEREGLVKMLTRRAIVFASLRLSPRTDIQRLVEYWSADGESKDLLPVLQAAASLPQGRELSLAALLPPRARALLFTFPLPAASSQPNCHWTAFNFFKKNPDPPTDNDEFWHNKLRADYVPVSDAPRYGDILLLTRPGDEFLHTCVFLADDLVYTKNGVSHWAPWQLTTIADLVRFYSWDLEPHQSLSLQYFRAKTRS